MVVGRPRYDPPHTDTYKRTIRYSTSCVTLVDRFTFTTKLWKRSQSSYGTTVPREILAIKDVPVGENVQLEWTINEHSGVVEVAFEREGSDGE